MIRLLLGTFFANSAGAIAKHVLIALGMGIISTAGVTVALNSLLDTAHAQYNSLGGYIQALVGLAGFGYALGILAGAMTFRAAMMITSRIGVIPK